MHVEKDPFHFEKEEEEKYKWFQRERIKLEFQNQDSQHKNRFMIECIEKWKTIEEMEQLMSF